VNTILATVILFAIVFGGPAVCFLWESRHATLVDQNGVPVAADVEAMLDGGQG
jgi:hypothetical protein